MKIKYNKNSWFPAGFKSSLILVLVVLQFSCNNFLEVEPQAQEPSKTFFQSEDDAMKAVNAMYANLHAWNMIAMAPLAVEGMTSGDLDKGSDPGDAAYLNNFLRFTVSSTSGQVNAYWTGKYQEINLCNQVLDSVPQIDMKEDLKARLLAEAKFIRAYSYFKLVRAFGDVPLRLHTIDPDNNSAYNIPRVSKDSVYMQIEKDLTEAAGVLPEQYGTADLGRVTKGAALALHAKVELYQENWDQAFDLSKQVIDMGIYQLFPNYEQQFRIQNENNSGSVFEIQCGIIAGNGKASNSQYAQIRGPRAIPAPYNGWGFGVPSQNLMDSYEDDDPRLDASILFRGETTPEGDLIPNAAANPRYIQKTYIPFGTRDQYAQYTYGSQQNKRVIRYAEVLLINAEAANELGNTQEALTNLNKVRKRARGGNPNVLPDITETGKDALRQIIWHERHVELAFEGDHFFDLVRQGRAAEVLGPRGFTAGKNEIMPIPQQEIDNSGGVLTQNPGYN